MAGHFFHAPFRINSYHTFWIYWKFYVIISLTEVSNMTFPSKILNLAKKLISFPTISKDSNLELIYYVANYLESYNITPTIQLNKSENKANLIATIGPTHVPGLILSGHTDVVPTETQNWISNPFSPWIDGERLYGRGTADMKGFIAVVLSLIPLFYKSDMNAPLHIVLTYDEEIGCFGAYELIKHFQSNALAKPMACLVGEPTEMHVINAHKGIKLLRTTVRGPTGHSSRSVEEDSSLIVMSELILFLKELNILYKKKPIISASKKFEQPYTTINMGQLRAGTAANIIPAESELLWEYRIISEKNEQEVLDRFIHQCEDKNTKSIFIKTDELAYVPPLCSSGNKSLTKQLLCLNGHMQSYHADYCTEAGIYQQFLGVPTILCGPGSIKQAHKENEYVELKQLLKANSLLIGLIKEICYKIK